MTDTHAFAHFAQAAASPRHAFSANEPGIAMISLQPLQPGTVRNFFFFGHGAGPNGDFIFNGQRTPEGGFRAAAGRRSLLTDTSENASRYFILRMAQLAIREGEAGVHAQFCWSAQGRLLADIASAFNNAGVSRYTIFGLRQQGNVNAIRQGGIVRYTIGPNLQQVFQR